MPSLSQLSSGEQYYNLGSFHRDVSTTSDEAQEWFNRGLVWAYAFNHPEARCCFEKAIAHDPTCVMAWWGIAYTSTAHYNKPWEAFGEEDLKDALDRIQDAVQHARSNFATVTPLEQALADAIQTRSPKGPEDKIFGACSQRYVDSMRSIYQNYSDDLDVATLYVDALLNLTPWQLWDLSTGKPSGPHTVEAKNILEKALTKESALKHPGLPHLYVHLMEMSPTPEAALTVADRLRGLVPDAGHLQHMPSHIDILIGDYRRAIASNLEAVEADEKILGKSGAMNFYSWYRMHDYQTLIYAAMFAGQSKIALETVERMEQHLPEEVLRMTAPPMADLLEGVLSTRAHALIRFGKWNEIIETKLPQDQELYCVTTAMTHYAKGIAYAATGNVALAEEQRSLLQSAAKRVPPTRMAFPNKVLDVLEIAKTMLDGELEYRKGNLDIAFKTLREAISKDDSLNYSEPWAWMLPTRHAYAALSLEQGRLEEAAEAYCADLGLGGTMPRARWHPNNVWALQGLAECWTRLGRTEQASLLQPQLNLALSIADVPIRSSCFCRRQS
ncbi:TPR domain protein [Saccharata proteae CBS 121410]|uniref:TPR domain protein n=1 Tax=Saccharata proteae CBS 121410 TaxID=1314787 RepID=A0A9P4HQA1_9PEZI|nr:TPR domain protein [Saccharata proteae CBS 121410]